jgi:hypothetical protein
MTSQWKTSSTKEEGLAHLGLEDLSSRRKNLCLDFARKSKEESKTDSHVSKKSKIPYYEHQKK